MRWKRSTGAKFAGSALEAVEGAEALIIATEWAEFANVDLAIVKEKMTTPIIFDGRNLFDPETMAKLGFHYHSIGRASVTPQLSAIRATDYGASSRLGLSRWRRSANGEPADQFADSILARLLRSSDLGGA